MHTKRRRVCADRRGRCPAQRLKAGCRAVECPLAGPEQARAHKRGGLGGCVIRPPVQPYVLRMGSFRYFGFPEWRAGRCGLRADAECPKGGRERV